MINVKGNPVVTTPACKACNDSVPPIQSIVAAIEPCTTAQKIRCGIGASILPPEVILSTTSDAESDDVIKKINTNIIDNTDNTLPNGSASYTWNNDKEISVKPHQEYRTN